MSRRDQRDTFTNYDRDNVNDEFVDLAGVEKGRNDFAAAHHPDIFAWHRAQLFGEISDWLIDNVKTRRMALRWAVGEDIISDARSVRRDAAFVHLLAGSVGFAAPQNRVDGFEERSHAVIAGSARPVKPIDVAVSTRDVSVGSGGNVNDDLARAHHLPPMVVLISDALYLTPAPAASTLNNCNSFQHRYAESAEVARIRTRARLVNLAVMALWCTQPG